ncbi:MAG: threonine--tRNA ligase [Candidatus Hadarchaeaceae archaeon]
MQLLLIHADYLKFEVKQRTPAAEEITPEQRSGLIEDALVVFSAAEVADEENIGQVAKNAAEDILNIAKRVEAQRIIIYPYAHLSSSLAPPKTAIKLLDATAELLRRGGFEVHRLPFGWYKAFTISCKGHPLSELSRTITSETSETAESATKAAASKWIILAPDGVEHELKLSDIESCQPLIKSPLLKQYLLSEELGQKPGGEPAHIRLMRRLELVDYEPASDTGHFRFYPNGALIKGLLEDFASQIAAEIGALRIETPVLYRADEPDIAEQVARFLQKDYKVRLPNRTLILRFSGDFGLFKMMKNTLMTYKQMPLRVFELSPSYRLEQSGETVGLKRLRAFTMPDIHCFCLDLNQGLEEYQRLFEVYVSMVGSMGVDYAVIFRVVEDFYRQNRDFIAQLLRPIDRPALIELLTERKHYWILKHEFQMIDSVGGNAQLSTIQLDLEDSERYGIRYIDERGEKRNCVILHSSIGSIERWIYAILEEAAKAQISGGVPCLPLWLAPTQVRLVPIASRHLDFCKEIAEILEKNQIRVDIDDRGESVSKKIRDAEREWLPYIVVIGDREQRSGKIPVRVRREKELKLLTLEELSAEIKRLTKGMPFRPLAMNRMLSLRPIFSGG